MYRETRMFLVFIWNFKENFERVQELSASGDSALGIVGEEEKARFDTNEKCQPEPHLR